ncbi:MAG: lysophospholipid acyltransferase family protein [Alcanivoracaceae bacterium]|nr:lysophospholipid acyltransferase family protein [Alcanivoracaceae bacterium]
MDQKYQEITSPGRKVSARIAIRSIAFFLLYNLMGIVHSMVCLLVAPFQTFEQRYRFVNLWTYGTMWLLRHLSGVSIEVHGAENIPKNQAVVIMANHQSQWETFYLQILSSPQATILKKELLWVPFFGWALALLKPIAIDRKKASQALKTILRVGKQRLDSGISVVIYPEGTRQQPGSLGRFNGGGASLAVSAQAPIVPVVHNSGDCWPARSLWRFPGTITVVIGAPISVTDKTVAQVKQEYVDWISANYPGELRINKAGQ